MKTAPQGLEQSTIANPRILEFSIGMIDYDMQEPATQRLAFFVRSEDETDLFNKSISELASKYGLNCKQITLETILQNKLSIASGLPYVVSQKEPDPAQVFVLNIDSIPFMREEVFLHVPVIKDIQSFARQQFPQEYELFHQKHKNISFIGPGIYETYLEQKTKLAQHPEQFASVYQELSQSIKPQIDPVLAAYVFWGSREWQYNCHFDHSMLIYGISPIAFNMLDKNDFDVAMHSPNDHRERLGSITGFCYNSFDTDDTLEQFRKSLGTTLSFEQLINNFIKGQKILSRIIEELGDSTTSTR